MIVVAGGNHGDRANVIPSICVPMNPLVQLWRSAQRQRPEKSTGGEDRDTSTHARAVSHRRRSSVSLTKFATIFWTAVHNLQMAVRIDTGPVAGLASYHAEATEPITCRAGSLLFDWWPLDRIAIDRVGQHGGQLFAALLNHQGDRAYIRWRTSVRSL
jgi:hypothetical protein